LLRYALAVLAGAVSGAVPALAQTRPCLSPSDAVQYVERPEGGPHAENGRTLRTPGNGYFGIDINSRIDILVDAACLRQVLRPPAAGAVPSRDVIALRDRAARLTGLANQTVDAARKLDRALDLYASARDSLGQVRANLAVDEFEEVMLTLNVGLRNAVRARLGVPAASPDEVRLASDTGLVLAELKRVTDPAFASAPYNFVALRDALVAEVALLEQSMQDMPEPPAFEIDLRAQHVARDGRQTAVHLPGFDEEEEGPDRRFEKIVYAVSDEEAQLYKQYDSLAKSMGQARSFGAAALSLLQQQYNILRPQLNAYLVGVRAAADTAVDRLHALGAWQDPATRRAWWQPLANQLATSDAGRQVVTKWADVEREVWQVQRESASLVDDARAVQSLVRTRTQLTGSDPLTAMNAALSSVSHMAPARRRLTKLTDEAEWERRARVVAEFLDAAAQPGVRQMVENAGGPISDLKSLRVALRQLADTTRATSVTVRTWLLGAITAEVPRSLATIPRPAGLRRAQLTTDVNTSINLRTLRGPRGEGDLVRVQYLFTQGDQPIAGGWRDEFRMRAFGWRARAVAGLAFTKATSESIWSPTASLSWLAMRRGWPAASDRGLKGLHDVRTWGFGVSTMSLNFDTDGDEDGTDDDQKIQIGLAATASILDDRILGGYGLNLQAPDEKGFWFFSIRLFSATGSLGGAGGR
jgi:hypothetical protein